jgi:hypothetical protein
VELSKVEVSVVKRVDLLMRKEVEDEDAKLPRRHTLGLAWHVRVGWVGCAVVGYGLITCWKLVCGSLLLFTDGKLFRSSTPGYILFQFPENRERSSRPPLRGGAAVV